MFESNSQSVTFFFVSDAVRAKSETVKALPPSALSATAPVKVRWVLG